ncbi:methyltransferase domain-containing protein [Phytoactinopolyspora halotolerans]|uniref:Arsenite methyltransferase n=1 Tax=Phytoactinopolyspora halotolerans TaxID=1981512 RepID=A0A6L9S5E5_9ACTN|nr:methyltransferase domain-containing protein [Phytoactinopolyspora halotolerans]NEE00675.1 methyltransferase domain-containing protein [Phytoactinopolyspora halotolerans]
MVVITSDQRDVIFDAVRTMYTAVADQPEQEYHFPTGRRALDYVGYPPEYLDRLPAAAIESFAGVGYPFAAEVLRTGDTVVDIGSGSGTDLLLAAQLVGPEGYAVGIDMTAAMRQKCLATARSAGLINVDVLEGNAESIPLPDASVDVVTSNGVINLVPDKRAAIAEIHRVLRPGGRVQLADIVVTDLPSAACRAKPQLWAECIVGATTDIDYLDMFRAAGFAEVDELSGLDYFAASTSDSTRQTARGFGAHSMVMRAVKPG